MSLGINKQTNVSKLNISNEIRPCPDPMANSTSVYEIKDSQRQNKNKPSQRLNQTNTNNAQVINDPCPSGFVTNHNDRDL